MTCIIGLVDDAGVWMGSDSASVSENESRITMLPKVFSIADFLIGYTTSFRMGQILQYQLIPPEHEDVTGMQYMVQKFIPAVRKVLKKAGFAEVKDGVETGGQFLVGHRGRLYCIDSDFQVNEHIDGFDIRGSGMEYALGAMSALATMAPRLRIDLALKIAAYYCPYVREPFHIKYMSKEKIAIQER